MRRFVSYRLGFGILWLFSLVVLIVVLTQAGAVRHDNQLYRRADTISTKLNDYTDGYHKVPASLAAARITNVPSAITYRKLSAKSYRFCVNYRSASSDYNSTRALDRLYGESTSDGEGTADKSTYLYIDLYHPKGVVCQTVSPNLATDSDTTSTTVSTDPFTKNSDGSYTVCNVHTNYFDGQGHVLQVLPGSISISALSYPYAGDRQLFMISPSSQFFDTNCKPLTAADIHPNDSLDVFDITSPTSSAVSIFLKY